MGQSELTERSGLVAAAAWKTKTKMNNDSFNVRLLELEARRKKLEAFSGNRRSEWCREPYVRLGSLFFFFLN